MKSKDILLIALPLIFFLAPQKTSAQKEQTKTFKGIKTVRMNTSSGSCKIQKSPDATVTALVRSTHEENVEYSMDQEGDRLVIRETFHANSTYGTAAWTLTVPDGLDIKFHTGSGSLDISDLKLDLDATTGSGDLLFKKLKGRIKATTGSGDLELDNFNGEIDVNIGSGSAVVQNSQGDVKLNCGSGTIRAIDSKAAFNLNTGSGRVLGRNIDLDGASSFNSGSGDTNVILAATPKHDISVSSGSGDAELNFNGHEIAGEVVMKASKNHGNIEAPFEFDKVEEVSEKGNNQVSIKKTAMKGNSSNHVKVSTGSGDAILKK